MLFSAEIFPAAGIKTFPLSHKLDRFYYYYFLVLILVVNNTTFVDKPVTVQNNVRH